MVADLRSRIVRLQNTVNGVAATGALTFAANAANNETVVINGITWTAKSASPSTAEYLIGATKEATAILLAAALNASANAAISVATYEAIGAKIRITYDTKGTIGNGFTLADSSGAHITRSAATLTNGTEPGVTSLTGAQTLSAKKISLTAAHTADDTYEGIQIPGLANLGGVTQWDAVYLNSDSQWVKADANGAGAFPAMGLAVATALTTVAVTVLVLGTVRNDAWNWTPGGLIYLDVTAGALTQTAPATTGDNVQQVGFAITADIAFFDFNSTFVEVP